MKRIITAFLCIVMVLSLSMTTFAAKINPDKKSEGVDIGTEVPTSHVVTVVKDENSMLYYEGNSIENGDKISIARLSSPEFLVYAKDGFQRSKVMLDTVDVMGTIKNSRFIIKSIHKDVTLTVNSAKRDFTPQTKYTVVGTIKQNEKPLISAELKLCENAKFTTKDDGKFAFNDVEDGFHTLTAFNNGKQVGYIAFEIRQSDVVKTIEIKKSDDGTYIINIGKDYHIVELNFDLKDNGIIDIKAGVVHESPKDIIDYPPTGDTVPIIPFIFITIGSLAIFAVIIKKRKYENGKR